MLAVLYISGLVVYDIAVYEYYSAKFRHAKNSIKGYHTYLNNIHKFYETQETTDTILDLDSETDEENTL